MPRDFVRRLRAIRDESAQIIRDAQHWNRLNPRERPLDVEPERVIVKLANDGLAAAKRGDRAGYSRTVNKLGAAARAALAER